jgi:Protein of unknown function (DUF1254)
MQPARRLGEEALERICVSAYPFLVSEAYERLLASRSIDPLTRAGRPSAVANADGATLVCRAAWLRIRESEIRLRTTPCNDYHVCSLVDAGFRPFASIGTRTAGNARQELVLLAPSSTASTSHAGQTVHCPTDLIGLVVHQVRFSGNNVPAAALPFCVEDQDGESLVDFERVVETADVVARVEALSPGQYFSDALAALHETSDAASAAAVEKAVQKSFATIAQADRSSFSSAGWTMIDHCIRDRTFEHRAAAVHAGFFSTKMHDVLELATRCDASGALLDGARTYCVRFARWNEPPAHASWFLHVAPAMPARVELERTEQTTNIMIGPSPPKGSENWIKTLPKAGPLEVRLILCWPSERARSEIWMPPDIVAIN